MTLTQYLADLRGKQLTVIGIGVRAAAKGDMVVALVSLVGTLVCLSVIF